MTTRTLYTAIGARIQARRKHLCFTQTDLAQCVGYDRPTSISDIETGRISLTVDKLIAIADALGVSIVDLLPESEAPTC